MRSDADDARRTVSSWKVRVCGIFALCILLLPGLAGCRKQPSVQGPATPSPPDLSRCTRLEIQYLPSTLECLFPGDKLPSLLSLAEREYVQSLKTIVMDDPQRIKAFARDVGSGSYDETGERLLAVVGSVHFVCYHKGKRLTSFTVIGPSIVTENKDWFEYAKVWPGRQSLNALTPQISPFRLRASCARNLDYLCATLSFLSGKEKAYLPASEWCDGLVRDYRNRGTSDESERGEAYIRRHLKCPSAGEGECHYAMNPDCTPSSPPDTVLLFEAKAGWNQHGGPGLFTFDNHDPKGGCVLLNDGTVKFIRTKEELEQLRWKE